MRFEKEEKSNKECRNLSSVQCWRRISSLQNGQATESNPNPEFNYELQAEEIRLVTYCELHDRIHEA